MFCSQSKYFIGTHSLVMHAYNALNLVLRSQHLELYKALCVFMMGWSYSFPSDNDKSYQSFPSPEAMEKKSRSNFMATVSYYSQCML